jgi:hypothetical protein
LEGAPAEGALTEGGAVGVEEPDEPPELGSNPLFGAPALSVVGVTELLAAALVVVGEPLAAEEGPD